eukprot:gene3651-biopygen12150
MHPQDMKRLTKIAGVFVPVTVCASILGMNVRVPFQETKNTNAFWTVLGCMMVFVVVASYFAFSSPGYVLLLGHCDSSPLSTQGSWRCLGAKEVLKESSCTMKC